MEAANFDELLDRYLSGEATADELARFEALLLGDAGKRRQLTERCQMEIELHKAFGGVLPENASVPLTPRRRPILRRIAVLAVAASVVLAMATVAYVAWPDRREIEIVSGNVQIAGASTDRIPKGVVFQVADQKPAVFELPDRSRVEFDATSWAAFHGSRGDARQVIQLQEGGGLFEVAPAGGEFRVETPAGNVTALGTAFSVKLRARKPDAKSKNSHSLTVAVSSGRVRVDANGESVVLAPRTSRVFGDDGQQNNNDDGQKNNQNNGNQGNQGSNQDGRKK